LDYYETMANTVVKPVEPFPLKKAKGVLKSTETKIKK